MKPGLTIDELIRIYGPSIRSNPSNKRRDPVERELLQRLGDPNVAREDPAMTKLAGERPTAENALKRPGPLPDPVKLQGEGPSASDIVLGDRE
jgi:hypothetical protein